MSAVDKIRSVLSRGEVDSVDAGRTHIEMTRAAEARTEAERAARRQAPPISKELRSAMGRRKKVI